MPSRAYADATVALTAAGVTVLIDGAAGRLPAVVHWGPELSDLDAGQAGALVGGSVPVVGSNNAALAPRVAVLPEHHTGWTGRPGLRGSFAGRGWSPAFATRSIALDGEEVAGFASAGPGVVEIVADDDTGRLRLHITIELLPQRAAPVAGVGDQPRRRGVHGRRGRAVLPGARRGHRAARLRRQPQPGTGAAARAVPHRHPRAGEPQGPHRRGQRLPAARRHGRLRLPRRRRLGGAHGLERQPRALRRAGLHRRAAHRRRRAAAAGRGAARDRRELPEPVGLRVVRCRPRRGRPPLPPAPARRASRRCRPSAR